MRWIMAGLAILGSALLGITGTLGGHLVGIYTEVSDALRFRWEVYTTYYVRNVTLATFLLGQTPMSRSRSYGDGTAEAIDQAVKALIDETFQTARGILERNRSVLDGSAATA